MKINHNDEFKKLQDKLDLNLSDVERKVVLADIYNLCLGYFPNLIANYAKHHNLSFNESFVEEKAADMSARFVSLFLKNKDFRVDRFTAYSYFSFLKEITIDEKWDKLFSVEALVESYDDNMPDFTEVGGISSEEIM